MFWNIAYYDKNYFNGLFENFVFPDGDTMRWESISWLQKRFMNWFNDERKKRVLTFPVETVNLLDDGSKYIDEEWFDFTAEMYAKGHSFFTYRSSSVDSLASCCFDGRQKVLTKSSGVVNYSTFEELYNAKYKDMKRNLTVFHNGSWCDAKVIKLPKRDTYKITTTNHKTLYVTDNHIHPTIDGEKTTLQLGVEDYLQFNTLPLDTFPEKDRVLSYNQGYLVGMYLGDGCYEKRNGKYTRNINLSLNESKYNCAIDILNEAIKTIDIDATLVLYKEQNNTYPVVIKSEKVVEFIQDFVVGDYCYEKELNLNLLTQSKEFRRGILDGYYLTDGGNSNRIYTSSQTLSEHIECLLTSLGLTSIIDCADRTDEACAIRGKSFNRNYPIYCIRWYDPKNKRSLGDVYKIRNNSIYYRIESIEKYESEDESVYCFEMTNENEPYFTLPNGVITHNCRLRNEISDNTFSFTLGAGGVSTGSKGVITININRLVQRATKEGKDISETVREQVLKIHKYLKAYNEILKSDFEAGLLSIYKAGYISLEKQFLTIGINGFVEGAEFLGIEISPNEEYYQYGEMILKPIYDENRKAKTDELMFNTEFVPKISGHCAA